MQPRSAKDRPVSEERARRADMLSSFGSARRAWSPFVQFGGPLLLMCRLHSQAQTLEKESQRVTRSRLAGGRKALPLGARRDRTDGLLA